MTEHQETIPGVDLAATSPAALAGPEGDLSDLGYRVSLDQFSGPMDLLLYLVKRTELDIVDIPLATITDQFVATVAEWHAMDLEVAGDFIVMAATLLEMKARMLAPPPPEGEEGEPQEEEEPLDPRADLIRRLLQYRRFKDAAQVIDELQEARQQQMLRQVREAIPEDPAAADDITLEDLDVHLLFRAYEYQMARISGLGPRRVLMDEVPMELRMARVVDVLQAERTTTLKKLLESEPNLVGQAGVLIATLEVIRQRFVEARQLEQYGQVDLRFRDQAERAIATSPPPEPPEEPGRRRKRIPLVTYQAADDGTEVADEPEERVETEEQRFLRELDQHCDLSNVMARAADIEAAFISHWQQLHPGELPPTIAGERAAAIRAAEEEKRRADEKEAKRRVAEELRAAKRAASWEQRKEQILGAQARKAQEPSAVPLPAPTPVEPIPEAAAPQAERSPAAPVIPAAEVEQPFQPVEQEPPPPAAEDTDELVDEDPAVVNAALLAGSPAVEEDEQIMAGDPGLPHLDLTPIASSTSVDPGQLRYVLSDAADSSEADDAAILPSQDESVVHRAAITTGMAAAIGIEEPEVTELNVPDPTPVPSDAEDAALPPPPDVSTEPPVSDEPEQPVALGSGLPPPEPPPPDPLPLLLRPVTPSPKPETPPLPMPAPPTRSLAWLIAAILTLLNVLAWVGYCWWVKVPRNLLEVVAGPVAEADQPWVWCFNLDAVRPEAVGAPLAVLPQVEPPVSGQWIWRDQRTLVFTPAAPLPPGCTVRVSLPAEDLRAPYGFRLAQDLATLLRTAPASATAAQAVAFAADGTTTVELAFDRPVEPARVAERVRVETDGTSVPTTPVSRERSTHVRLALNAGVERDGALAQLRFTPVEPGPARIDGPVRLDPQWRSQVALGHQLRATAISAASPTRGTPSIAISLNQPAAPREVLVSQVLVEPEVGFAVVSTAEGLRLEGGFIPGTSYTVRIVAAWPEAGAPVQAYPAAAELQVDIPNRTPGLWFVDPSRGRLDLAGVNLGTVLVRVYDPEGGIRMSRALDLGGEPNAAVSCSLDADLLLAELPPDRYRVVAEATDATGTVRGAELAATVRSASVPPERLAAALIAWAGGRLAGRDGAAQISVASLGD